MIVTDAVATAEPLLTIRRVSPEDAAAVAGLSVQLGYKATAAEIAQRIAALGSCKAYQAVFVACRGPEIVGWIDVALSFDLQAPPYALIGGLVVKDDVRGLRIGKRLCDEAEAWSRAQGVSVLRVTSGSTRADAHRFYLREGFKDIKMSRVFEKNLG
jgi:GNAT superfamily N-acetyltransferase